VVYGIVRHGVALYGVVCCVALCGIVWRCVALGERRREGEREGEREGRNGERGERRQRDIERERERGREGESRRGGEERGGGSCPTSTFFFTTTL
jgi:hypothetical protein